MNGGFCQVWPPTRLTHLLRAYMAEPTVHGAIRSRKRKEKKRGKKTLFKDRKKLLVVSGVHSPMTTPPPGPQTRKKKKKNLPYHLGSTFDKKKSYVVSTCLLLTGLFPQICANLGSTIHGFFWTPQIQAEGGGVGGSHFFLVFWSSSWGSTLGWLLFIPPFF